MSYMDPRPEGLNTEKAPESIVETLKMPDNKTMMFDAPPVPCPFCGSTKITVADLAGWEVWCEECGASCRATDPHTQEGWATSENAIAAWNTRAPTPAAQSAGQEAVAEVRRNDAGQISMCAPDGSPFDMSKHVGQSFYAAPVNASELVAWFTDDHLTDKSATTWDRSTAERWRAKGWPVHGLCLAEPVNGGERELGQVIDERDQYHDAAEKLADAIAKHFGVEIGEHSNLNCPWQNALDHIAQATKRAADAQQVGQMSDRQIIELCKSVGVEWEGPDMCDFMGDFGRVNMAGMRAIINAAKEQK